MDLDIYNIQGDKTGTYSFDIEGLGEAVNPTLLHRAVVSYEANQRQGSACTKTRGDRAGSGKKLWRQKGTGRARVGSIRSPLWRGGGVTFGPKPKSYEMKLSKKEKAVALKGSLRGKLEDKEVLVLESAEVTEAKTKNIAGFLNKAELSGQKVLVVLGAKNENFLRASKNIKTVSSMQVSDLNALSVLSAHKVIFEKSAIEAFSSKEAK
jgi:large subunit ribosomal protein L4